MIPLLSLLSLLQLAPAAPPPPPGEDPHPGRPAFEWVDFDGDGRLDVLALDGSGTARLLRNEGEGRFDDATARVGLAGLGDLRTAAWKDLDVDGWPDLVLVTRGGRLRLLGNEAGAGFADRTVPAGLAGLEGVRETSWIDVDADGDLELFVQRADSAELLRNEGGRFEPAERLLSVTTSVPIGPGPRSATIVDSAFPDETPDTPPAPDRESNPGATTGSRSTAAALGPISSLPTGPRAQSSNAALFCADSLKDVVSGACLTASTIATLGSLYPLSNELFVDGATGFVGVNTSSPQHRFHVEGQFVAGVGSLVTGSEAVVSGGLNNTASGDGAVVTGGRGNVASDSFTTVAGGSSNDATGAVAVVGGGQLNEASGGGSIVTGGQFNKASGLFGAVLGGDQNEAAGTLAVVVGGARNLAAGDFSLAAGSRAQAVHDGAFVWADNTTAQFASTAPKQFLVRASGGVGVNTTAPEAPLHVFKGSAGSVTAHSNSVAAFENSTSAFISILSPDGISSGILFGNPSSSTSGGIVYDQASVASQSMQLRTGGNLTRMTILAGGNVGVGTTSPSAKLEVAGIAKATSFVQTSDARLKRDVRGVEGAMGVLQELDGVSYEWDPELMADAPQGRHLGLLAQQVREVLPEAVVEAADGRLAVEYSALVPVLVEALKDKDAELIELRALLAELSGRIDSLELSR